MTKEQFAELLNGREYGRDEIVTTDEAKLAKSNRLVVVFGESDDIMMFRGAIDGECDAYEGGTAYLSTDGLFENKCSNTHCPYAKKEEEKLKSVTAFFGIDPAWRYETDISHAMFDIFEDGEVYCRGIVFDIESLV